MPEFTLESMVKFICDPKSIQQVNNTVSGLKSMIGKALGAIGIGFSLKAMNAAVEQVRSVNMALESAVGQFGDIDEIQKKILETSKDVVGNYEDVAKNVADLVKNNKTLFDVDKATRFTDIMTKLTKLSGGSNTDATGLVSSMANAMKNGKFDSGSLEALFAKAPQAIKILTDYYGVSERKLRMMAQAGILKAKDIQNAFMNAGEAVDKSFGEMAPKITDVLTSARSQLKYFIEETDEMFGLTQAIAKFLRSGFQTLMGWLQKVRSGILFLTQKLGGMENTLKLIAVIASSIFIAMNFGKIVSGIKSVIGILKTLNVKALLIVAVITAIILAIDDFVAFVQGRNSLIGVILKKNGVDVEKAREKTISALRKVAEFFRHVGKGFKDGFAEIKKLLSDLWRVIGPAVTKALNFIGALFADAFQGIKKLFGMVDLDDAEALGKILSYIAAGLLAIGAAMAVIAVVTNPIALVIAAIVALVAAIGLLVNHWDEVVAFFKGIGKAIADFCVNAWNAMINWFVMVGQKIADFFKGIWDAIKNWFSSAVSATAKFFADLWNGIVQFFVGIGTAIADFFKGIWEKIKSIGQSIADFFSGLWSSIKETVGGIKDTIVEKFQEAVDWIVALPGKALEWGSNIINKIIEGILGVGSSLKETVEGIFEDPIGFIKGIPDKAVEWGKDIAGGLKSGIEKGAGAVKNAASWVAGKVSGVLHFSEPDEGPLSNFHTYMPDMIKMMVKGIRDGVPAVQKVMNVLTEAMSADFASGFDKLAALADSRFVFQKTAGAVTNSNNISRNVVQNVEISNTFNGDRAGQQKASAAMRSAAQDSTAQMGRALQYAR